MNTRCCHICAPDAFPGCENADGGDADEDVAGVDVRDGAVLDGEVLRAEQDADALVLDVGHGVLASSTASSRR